MSKTQSWPQRGHEFSSEACFLDRQRLSLDFLSPRVCRVPPLNRALFQVLSSQQPAPQTEHHRPSPAPPTSHSRGAAWGAPAAQEPSGQTSVKQGSGRGGGAACRPVGRSETPSLTRGHWSRVPKDCKEPRGYQANGVPGSGDVTCGGPAAGLEGRGVPGGEGRRRETGQEKRGAPRRKSMLDLRLGSAILVRGRRGHDLAGVTQRGAKKRSDSDVFRSRADRVCGGSAERGGGRKPSQG